MSETVQRTKRLPRDPSARLSSSLSSSSAPRSKLASSFTGTINSRKLGRDPSERLAASFTAHVSSSSSAKSSEFKIRKGKSDGLSSSSSSSIDKKKAAKVMASFFSAADGNSSYSKSLSKSKKAAQSKGSAKSSSSSSSSSRARSGKGEMSDMAAAFQNYSITDDTDSASKNDDVGYSMNLKKHCSDSDDDDDYAISARDQEEIQCFNESMKLTESGLADMNSNNQVTRRRSSNGSTSSSHSNSNNKPKSCLKQPKFSQPSSSSSSSSFSKRTAGEAISSANSTDNSNDGCTSNNTNNNGASAGTSAGTSAGDSSKRNLSWNHQIKTFRSSLENTQVHEEVFLMDDLDEDQGYDTTEQCKHEEETKKDKKREEVSVSPSAKNNLHDIMDASGEFDYFHEDTDEDVGDSKQLVHWKRKKESSLFLPKEKSIHAINGSKKDAGENVEKEGDNEECDSHDDIMYQLLNNNKRFASSATPPFNSAANNNRGRINGRLSLQLAPQDVSGTIDYFEDEDLPLGATKTGIHARRWSDLERSDAFFGSLPKVTDGGFTEDFEEEDNNQDDDDDDDDDDDAGEQSRREKGVDSGEAKQRQGNKPKISKERSQTSNKQQQLSSSSKEKKAEERGRRYKMGEKQGSDVTDSTETTVGTFESARLSSSSFDEEIVDNDSGIEKNSRSVSGKYMKLKVPVPMNKEGAKKEESNEGKDCQYLNKISSILYVD